VVGPSKEASKQMSKHTQAWHNEVMLVWGSLRLTQLFARYKTHTMILY